MPIQKINIMENTTNTKKFDSFPSDFKNVLRGKFDEKLIQNEMQGEELPNKTGNFFINNTVKNIFEKHQLVARSIKSMLKENNQSPRQLLAAQYNIGGHFYKVQMFGKGSELLANTFNRFTQMNV